MQTDKNKIKNKDSKISQQNHIVKELGENGDIQYNCTACHKTFGSRSQKYYHLTCNQLENKLYKCEHCDKSFARLSQWKYHIESHLSPVNECQKCQKIFSNPLALKKHISLHNVEVKLCPHCDKTFKKKISLEQHIAAQHLNQLQYGCAFCSKKYASKSSLQLHLQTHDEKRFECSFCGKLFQRNSILNQHLKRHYNTNSYRCTVCPKVFSETGSLARHRKTHEDDITQYYCKLCDKSILRKDNMTRHLNTIHPEEKFENIVDIMKPSKKTISQENNKSYESYSFDNVQEHSMKTQENIVIIENKLLQKPFESNDSIIDLPKNTTNETNQNEEYPLVNQIKVITAVSTYKQEMYTNKYDITHNRQTYLESPNLNNITSNNNLCQMPAQIQTENKGNNVLHKTEIVISSYEKCNDQLCLETQNNFKTSTTGDEFSTAPQFINYNLPKTEKISSVIRSVGNVKKNLTPLITTPAKVTSETSLEYKHKKYCRNNYNIDLYRKILGCDEDEQDDDDIERNELKESEHNSIDLHSQNYVSKSSTPVHWRKSFKNIYETSSS